MNLSYFYILHVFSVIFMVAQNFFAFSAQRSERRKKNLMLSGIASLLVFLTGFGIHGMLKMDYAGWFFVKILCWLILSALAGMAYRFTSKIKLLTIINLVAVLTAVTMVYLKPF